MAYALYSNNDLWISTGSSKHRAQSGYNYFVTSWACTAHSAFTTMSELKRWLRNRGLSMPSKVKSKNNPVYRKLIGNYDRCYTWDLAEFEQIRKIADLNGDGLVLVDDIGELKTNIGKQKQIIEWSNIWKQKKYWWLMMNPE